MMLIEYLKRQYLAMIQTDSDKYVQYLKKKGCNIGCDVHLYDSSFDMALLSLITIGDHVTLTGTTILAHDASTQYYLGKTKVSKVSIGNNVFSGLGSIILAGSTIGNNVIIGAGTVVRGEVPDNCVIIGNPWRMVCSIDEYIDKNAERLNHSKVYDYKSKEGLLEMKTQMEGIGWIC